MKHIGKKGLALLLALILLLALFPMSLAAPEDEMSDTTDASESWVEEIDYVFVIFLSGSYDLKKGDSLTVNDAFITGDDGTLSYSWSSSNPSVASVRGSGKSAVVSAQAPGTAEITLTATRRSDGDSDYDTFSVTVKAPESPVKLSVNGSSSLTMTAGTNQSISATASGGSGSYSYQWDFTGDSIGIDKAPNAPGTDLYARRAGSGTVTLTAYDSANASNYATASWSVTVNEASKPLTASISQTTMTLGAGKTGTLSLTASGGSGNESNYMYYWSSDSPGVVSISGSGKTVTLSAASALIAGSGSVQISATVADTTTNTTSETVSCLVTVENREVSYSASASATYGSSLGLNTIAKNIADEYARQFGATLNYGASVRLTSPSGRCGVLRLQDDTQVASGASYTYAILQDMYFNPVASGDFSTGYTIVDGGNIISGTINISVAGGTPVKNASLSPSKISLSPYSNQHVLLGVEPANAAYDVTWSIGNSSLISIVGSGNTVTLSSHGRAGTTTLTASIRDCNGNVLTRSIPAEVVDDFEDVPTYDPSLTVTIGSDYYGTSISDSIARQWRSYYSVALANDATVWFGNVGTTRYGKLHLSNGSTIKANVNYTFLDLINMYFEPIATGTYYVPYNVIYRGHELSGNIRFYVIASNLSVDISPMSATLSPYSSQYVKLNVYPTSAYYRVSWSSSNVTVATVSGNGASATITSTGRAGTATITAAITDANNTTIYRTCSVTVTDSSAAAAFDTTVYTTLGVNYTGTGSSDAMVSQYRSLYGGAPDKNSAIIRFDSTGDNKVGIMRLGNGAAMQAKTNYTLAQYVSMYVEPLSAGTFRVPYTMSYNGKTLSGTANFVINIGTANCMLTMSGTKPYAFNQNLTGGAGGVQLGNAITNAVGSSWTYIRFNSVSDNVGTLYQNDRSAVLKADTNLTAQALSNLYFVPNRPGTFAATYTVYSNNGKLSDGTLQIVVPGDASYFSDVPTTAYYADAVSWAVQKEVTSGTSATTFSPTSTVTRAQAVTFLWRAMGRPNAGGSNPFKDVASDEYYTNAVLWAVKMGITKGTSETTFSPNATLSQAQMMTFLCRAFGGDASGDNWADMAFNWARGRGLFNGLSAEPKSGSDCPRADVVYYLWKNAV